MAKLKKIYWNNKKDLIIIEEPLERSGSIEVVKIVIYKINGKKLEKIIESEMYKKVTMKKHNSNEELVSEFIKREKILFDVLNKTREDLKEKGSDEQ
ncbi:MAG: hypothetical protein ABGW69_00590 [Nanoarchaeota archaeon]